MDDGQVGGQVLVLLAGLAVAPQNVCRAANIGFIRGAGGERGEEERDIDTSVSKLD